MERMLARWGRALAGVGALIGAPAALAQAISTPPAAPASATTTDTSLRFGSVEDRMTVPVSVAGQGPWRFVIDTGAERSVVSLELAEQLGLRPGPALRVIGMAGAKILPSAIVPALSVSTVPPTDVVAPAIAQSDLGAMGMLGIDALKGHRVDIDFDRAVMTLRPSRRHVVVARSDGEEVIVIAKSMFGQLIVTDAHWRGRPIAVVIDTGSSLTVGNAALQRLIAQHAHPLGAVTAYSVTGATLATQAFTVGRLSLGGMAIDEMPVAFADAEPFRKFGLERRPAIMLGMDALRLFRRVRIDFANRAIEFVLPRALQTTTFNLPGG